MPPNQHLGGCSAASFGDGGDCRVSQQRSFRQRCPCLGGDAALGVHLPQLRLRQPRMQLDLVDRRNDAGGINQDREVLGLEIADSDGPDPALIAQVSEGLEGVDELVERRLRPMDQVRVEIVEPKPVHAGLTHRGKRPACSRSPGRYSTIWSPRTVGRGVRRNRRLLARSLVRCGRPPRCRYAGNRRAARHLPPARFPPARSGKLRARRRGSDSRCSA